MSKVNPVASVWGKGPAVNGEETVFRIDLHGDRTWTLIESDQRLHQVYRMLISTVAMAGVGLFDGPEYGEYGGPQAEWMAEILHGEAVVMTRSSEGPDGEVRIF
jgi:hypothetical protein